MSAGREKENKKLDSCRLTLFRLLKAAAAKKRSPVFLFLTMTFQEMFIVPIKCTNLTQKCMKANSITESAGNPTETGAMGMEEIARQSKVREREKETR
jgi:hypothetical protein